MFYFTFDLSLHPSPIREGNEESSVGITSAKSFTETTTEIERCIQVDTAFHDSSGFLPNGILECNPLRSQQGFDGLPVGRIKRDRHTALR